MPLEVVNCCFGSVAFRCRATASERRCALRLDLSSASCAPIIKCSWIGWLSYWTIVCVRSAEWHTASRTEITFSLPESHKFLIFVRGVRFDNCISSRVRKNGLHVFLLLTSCCRGKAIRIYKYNRIVIRHFLRKVSHVIIRRKFR